MSKYILHLTRQDWRRASPGDPKACLIAQGLRRELGGDWSVAGGHATEWEGDTVRRRLRLGYDARSVMRWFDCLGLKTRGKVSLYGDVRRAEKRANSGAGPAGGCPCPSGGAPGSAPQEPAGCWP